MRISLGWRLFLPMVMCVACGCASWLAPNDAGFGDVQATIRERLDKAVRWSRDEKSTATVSAEVRDLLSEKLTADEAVQVALLNNRRLQAVYEDLGVGRAELVQAGLLHNPVFEGSLKMHGDDHVYEFAVVQDFLDIFMIPLRRARARANLEQAKRRVTSAVIDMAGRARIAFYRYQAAEQKLALLRTVLASAEAAYDAARRLHEAGNTTDLALATRRALYEGAKIGVSRAETAAAAAREKLNALLGLYGEQTGWQAAGALPDIPEEAPSRDDLERRAIEASVDLAAAQWRIEQAGQVLGIARMKSVIPELAGGLEGEREPDGTWFLGPLVEFAIPIFDWGQGKRRRAAAELRRAWHTYTALAVEIRAGVRAAHVQATDARQQAIYYRDVLVPLNERITRETQLQFNAMQLGVFALLAAKQRELQIKREYIDTLLGYWTAHARLGQILDGRLVNAGLRQAPDMGAAGGGTAGGNGH